MNMEDFDSDGSDIDIEFKGFESESEDEDDFVPVDPLDRAQKWELLDTEGEEEDDFRGFQGPVSESRFSENSELVNPEMRETLVFQFHKASSALL